MSTTIAIRQLMKTYPAIAPAPGAPRTTSAVDSVDLTIEAGELFFLLGPSGCGKTTLLRMIAGFIEPTGGSISFQRGGEVRDVTFLPPNKRDTGMVFQSYALWPHMTVAENVAFGLEVRGIDASERQKRVRDALEVVQMGHLAARKPTQLSGGQQQRVALARALVVRPAVLLLDEPLSNLDAKLRIELRSEIRRVCKQSGITTIYVTHDQKEALSMADRVAIMRAGRVVQLGTPEGLYRGPRSRFVAEFLGETNILAGEVAAIGTGTATVRLAGAEVGCTCNIDGVAVGGTASISVRPEAIVLGDQGIPGRIVDRIYLGDHAQVMINLDGGGVIRASMSNPKPSLRDLDRVRISFSAEDAVVVADI